MDSAEEIFLQARELTDAADLDRYLLRACGQNPDLRRRVEALLAAAARADAYFGRADGQATAPAPDPAAVALPESPGSVIGPYRLEEQLGEGGMGIVYRAVQTSALVREVALKVVKPGMDTRQVIARFEAERQALALMDHPGIARVYDAGTTVSGRPYFVMELVSGTRLTDHCDRLRLPVRPRLELYIAVCQALEHAHQKGIIHRDLKPSNILVSPPSAVAPLGSPRVIDFGIAKAVLAGTDSAITLTSQSGFLGTPAYMSPEQALHGGRDVDTRTDVYSLGVILYELLTGSTPFDSPQTREGGLPALECALREQEPLPPSSRISRLPGSEAAALALARSDIPHRWSEALRGDLDWIVLKCLEKDRERRYASVSALAADLRHHLACEPVSARPPSTAYRVDRWVRRNRLLVASASLVLLSLIAGLGIASWQFVRARQAHHRAENEAQRAQEAAAHNRQVSEFLEAMLLSVGPSHAQGRDTQLLQDLLASATAKFRDAFSNAPASEAKLRATFAKVYADLGDYTNAVAMNREAARLYQNSLGSNHPFRLAVLNNLAADLQSLNRLSESVTLLKECLLAQQQRPDADPFDLAMATANVAILEMDLGHLEDARAGFAEARRRLAAVKDPEPGFVAALIDREAVVLSRQGRFAEAEAAFREALVRTRAARGDRHPEYAGALNNLGNALLPLRRFDDALATLTEAVTLKRALLGSQHPSLAGSIIARGSAFLEAHQLSAAEADFREALSLLSGPIGGQVPQLRTDALNGLVGTLLRLRRLENALSLLQSHEISSSGSPSPPPGLLLAQLLARSGAWSDAASAYSRLVEGLSTPDPHGIAEWGLSLFAQREPSQAALAEWRRLSLSLTDPSSSPASARSLALACLVDPEGASRLGNRIERWIHAGEEPGAGASVRLLRAFLTLRSGDPKSAADLSASMPGSLGLDPALASLAWQVHALAQHLLGNPSAATDARIKSESLETSHLPAADSGDWGPDWRVRLATIALRAQSPPAAAQGAPRLPGSAPFQP